MRQNRLSSKLGAAKYGLPMVLLMVGGSFILSQFVHGQKDIQRQQAGQRFYSKRGHTLEPIDFEKTFGIKLHDINEELENLEFVPPEQLEYKPVERADDE